MRFKRVMKKYLKLLRVKHYLKNGLIFLPLAFSGQLFQVNLFIETLIGYVAFCMVASAIYIFNDIQDVEKDRLHPIKKNRPIASGTVSIGKAAMIGFGLIVASVVIQLLAMYMIPCKTFLFSFLFIYGYFILNLLYSKWLKHIPIVDVMVLAFGFILRVLYGGAITNIEISNWLFLTILSICLFAGFGKRRNEMMKNSDNSRKVLTGYNKAFLDKSMYVFLTLALVFYSLWCTNGFQFISNNLLIYSILFVIFIVLKYSLIIESDSYGDPIDVIFGDKLLMIISIIYCIYMVVAIYV